MTSRRPDAGRERPGRRRLGALVLVLAGAATGCSGHGGDMPPADAAPPDAGDATADATPAHDTGTDVPDFTDVGGDTGSDTDDSTADAASDTGELVDSAADTVGPVPDTDADVDDAPPEVGIRVRFDPDGPDFWDMPWPHDARRSPDGHPDMAGFPTGDVDLVRYYAETVERDVDGFSTLPVVYAVLDTAIPAEAFPTPAESLLPDAAVRWIHLGERCGQSVPIEVDQTTGADRYQPADTLRIAPVPGFFLEPAAAYAVLVRRDLGESLTGLPLLQPPAMRAALAQSSGIAALDAAYEPVADCLRRLDINADSLGLIVPLTTQDPTRVLDAIVRAYRGDDVGYAPVLTEFFRWEALARDGVEVWRGTFEAAMVQSGTPPYTALGGSIELDADGLPIVTRREPVPFVVSWRPDSPTPRPVLLWVEGTGASLDRSARGVVVDEALARGFAVASFVPQFHPGRGASPPDVALATYNYFNPDAGRSNFAQQAADTLSLVRVLEDAADDERFGALDPTRIVYGGHSQGGQVGSMLAGATDVFGAYVLNGVGAALSITVIERRDPVDIAALLRAALRITGPLDRKHPIVQLVQLAGDVAEPGNYALRWRGAEDRPSGNHVLVVVGDADVTTSVASMNALLIAGQTDAIEPAGWEADPLGLSDLAVLAPPFAGNRTGLDGTPRTLAAFLSPGSPHSTLQSRPELVHMAGGFWSSAVSDASPLVDLPAE